MKLKKSIKWIFVLLFFGIALFLAEMPPFGSAAVALHNGGYGTFDMKTYTYEIVNQVLGETSKEGFAAYDWYYACDFLFILAFGIFQISLSVAAFKKYSGVLRTLAILFPVSRGILDGIENVLLMCAIHSYPHTSYMGVSISNIITRCKFFCIGAWGMCMVIGFFYIKIRKQKDISQK